jgi:hypothetical protein
MVDWRLGIGFCVKGDLGYDDMMMTIHEIELDWRWE